MNRIEDITLKDLQEPIQSSNPENRSLHFRRDASEKRKEDKNADNEKFEMAIKNNTIDENNENESADLVSDMDLNTVDDDDND